MRTDLPSGTVTFCFTDVEGSTRLLYELGAEGYAEALAEHRRVIREACAAQGGVEVDTQGDAFFFAFPTAPGAVAAAAAFTEALSSGPVQVRVGLHTGDPLLAEEGYVGEDVHVAARIASSAHGGQVVLSGTTAAAVEPRDNVSLGLSFRALGEHRLKDVEGPVAIFQLGEGRFPPLKTISNTNLPRPASSFVGRERELAEVLARLREGARLVTLTGPGGSGKTRLALEAAASLVPEFKAGVFWVGLSSLRDPALVPQTIAQVLGAKDGLAEHIAERELLLLLDNVEQVVEAAPELASLVERCPNLTLLVTSRQLMRVRGEVEYEVPPLASTEAVALFCERSQLKPSAEIAELCARLDSLPLGVELAAARTKALTVAQILERLSQRLDLLRGGRDADPRQQTLRATIEWSYELLTPAERRLFARLSVFAGGCTLEAAEEVCDADLDTLQSLVEKSLLRFSDGRYWMLETIREYAAERLVESGDAEPVREGHARHFLRLAEESRRSLRGPEQMAWLQRLVREEDNLRAALDWAVTGGESLAFRLAHALEVFWIRANRGGEAESWLDRVLRLDPPKNPLERARALATGGIFAASVETKFARLGESIPVLRELGDEDALAFALRGLAWVQKERGELARAREALEEAVSLFERHGHSVATRLVDLGLIALELGDHDQAWEWLQRALEAADREGDFLGALGAFEALGDLEFGRCDLAEAERWYRRGIEAATEFDPVNTVPFLAGLARVAIRRGYFERAGRLWGEAERLAADADAAVWRALSPRHERFQESLSPRARRAFERGRSLASAAKPGS